MKGALVGGVCDYRGLLTSFESPMTEHAMQWHPRDVKLSDNKYAYCCTNLSFSLLFFPGSLRRQEIYCAASWFLNMYNIIYIYFFYNNTWYCFFLMYIFF